MAQVGKASSKRGKPSYFMSILGVTLVLFLLGIMGWLSINSKKLMQYFKESVEVQVFLKRTVNDTDHIALQQYIAAKPYTLEVHYTDKETAKAKWLQTGGEDFTEFIDNMLLPESIDFKLKSQYVDSVQLAAIRADISRFDIVDEVKYPTAVVRQMQQNFRFLNTLVAVLAIVIAVLVIILIDNTIRLAMFSNRFLIKTMQMVGATRGFIARPLDARAVVNGFISGIMAIAVLYLCILAVEKYIPDIKALRDNFLLILLFCAMVFIGIAITLLSTHRSVIKYLRMKLDELY